MKSSLLSKRFDLDYSYFFNGDNTSFLKKSKENCYGNLLKYIKSDSKINFFNDSYGNNKYTINKIEYIKNDICNSSEYENTEEGWTLLTGDSFDIVSNGSKDKKESSYKEPMLKQTGFDEKNLEDTKNNLLDLISVDVFRVGFDSISSTYFNNILKDNPNLAKKSLLGLLYDHYEKEEVVYGILSILSIVEYKKVVPEGPIIAMALTSYDSDTIKESLVRVFENWCNEDSLRLLEKIKFDDPWLNEYLLDVIKDIKEYNL